MRTISYLVKQESDGSIKATTVSRGALCYSGRVLLEQYGNNEEVEQLVKFGPMDMVGFPKELCENMINPICLESASVEQVNRLPHKFRNGSASFESFDDFKKVVENHTHFGVVNYFLHKNDTWFYSKHTPNKFVTLTKTVVFYDDEDNG